MVVDFDDDVALMLCQLCGRRWIRIRTAETEVTDSVTVRTDRPSWSCHSSSVYASTTIAGCLFLGWCSEALQTGGDTCKNSTILCQLPRSSRSASRTKIYI